MHQSYSQEISYKKLSVDPYVVNIISNNGYIMLLVSFNNVACIDVSVFHLKSLYKILLLLHSSLSVIVLHERYILFPDCLPVDNNMWCNITAPTGITCNSNSSGWNAIYLNCTPLTFFYIICFTQSWGRIFGFKFGFKKSFTNLKKMVINMAVDFNLVVAKYVRGQNIKPFCSYKV